jgi:hypothetical protein
MDEFTRPGLALEVASTLPASRVRNVLNRLVAQLGAHGFMRSDNGPELVALALTAWLALQRIGTAYIDRGSPWQNGYGERFNGTARDECLNMHLFRSVTEARLRLEAFRREYNSDSGSVKRACFERRRRTGMRSGEFRSGYLSQSLITGGMSVEDAPIALCRRAEPSITHTDGSARKYVAISASQAPARDSPEDALAVHVCYTLNARYSLAVRRQDE